MHSVKPGPANQSYGLQVARLAGMPAATIRLARDRLTQLEQHALQGQGDLFAALPPETEAAPPGHPLQYELAAVDPDEMTPREALDWIYRLKRLAKS